MADKNHFPGIDIVKFGENISIIQKRTTFESTSVLDAYEKALAIFRDYYQYEVIQGGDRKKMEKIPEAAFREAIANALIHRVWDVDAHIRVSMFDDRIEVISPGELSMFFNTSMNYLVFGVHPEDLEKEKTKKEIDSRLANPGRLFFLGKISKMTFPFFFSIIKKSE